MRETRHLWIGNLAENTREERIAEHFKRYGKIDKVRFLPKRGSDGGLCACVAFMDIRSAQKAKATMNTIGDRDLITDYYDPSRGATSTAEEGQRHTSQQQQPHRSSTSRRYEPHRESGTDDRFGRERQASYDRPYQQSDVVAPESYDSDRSRPRNEAVGNEKVKSRSRSSNAAKNDPASKKYKQDPSGKPVKKKAKKKNEEGKVKSKKAKQRHQKERGRSPTVKHNKSHGASASGSPTVGRRGAKTGSSSEGRSSSSGSISGSTNGSKRSSSASSSSSSGSTNSSKTPTSPSRSSGSSYEVEEDPERKLVAMCIRKLPIRPTVTSLRDGIFHEFKKYGKVKSVLVRGDGADRHALVLFRTAAEANKAITHAKSKLLFGAAIEASIYDGEVSGQELEECGGIIDEFHPRGSRTLFVGNLDKTVGYSDIQNIFVRFGEIVAIEIKKQHNIPQYAFLQYTDIGSVVRAITKMDGEKLGRNTLKLGFGKTVMSSCLWVDGVTDSFTENYLASCFQRYGPVKHVVIDRNRGQALVFYAQYDFAQTAMAKMRARKLNGSRLKLDYASNELIEIFLKNMQNSGQSIQGLENIRQLLQPPLSPGSTHQSSSTPYNRSQESRGSYYDDRSQGTYGDEQYGGSEGNYRRNWRGRSRERHPYPTEQSRQKRSYDEPYERSDYHRDNAWEHDGYNEGNRRTSHYDQDYRQRDYDVRRDSRGYNRKPSRGNTSYDEPHHYRGPRERPREERDPRDRDPYYSSSRHMSPSHPRYLSRRSRSISPHPAPRDLDRYSVERTTSGSGYRRHGRSASRSPDSHVDSIRRQHSIESKSSSRSGSRYTSRTGDVDMREYLDEDKLSVASPRGDERIVEFSEKAKKLRVRKRVTADSPSRDNSEYSDKEGSSQFKQHSESYENTNWQSGSPSYSDNRSRSGTPTRDENEDLIGEVIIKQPSKTHPMEKTRSREDLKSAQYDIDRGKEKSKAHDKDYRKGFISSGDQAKGDSSKTKTFRSNSASLIQRVHSPSDLERRSSTTFTKDFDYRKHAVVRSSKSSNDAARHKTSKTTPRGGEEQKRSHSGSNASNSPRSASPSAERPRGHSSSNLLKREYSPKPDDDKPIPAKIHKSSERSRPELDKQKLHVKDRARHRDDDIGDSDDKKSYSQKRRHSTEAPEDEEVSAKRERKSSSSHHQGHQKHDAPMSIASQMFLQEEEENGAESPAVAQKDVMASDEKPSTSKWEGDDVKSPVSPGHSPTNEFSRGSLLAAQSLLPKKLPKAALQKQPVEPQQIQLEKTEVKKESNEGNLTELEKEKVRLQKLLSKLDSEKQLDKKDAEEVAGVVLKALTEKARSEFLASKPQREEPAIDKDSVDGKKSPSGTLNEVVDEAVTEEIVEHETFSGEETIEEEIVLDVDTIEEVTEEDEVIETEEVEEVTVKDEVENPVVDEVEVAPISEEIVPEIPVPVVPAKPDDIDHSQGYRKQMEAKKKEMEKQERKKEHERKKLFKKQEKEKKKQMKKVLAMRGPSQSVISYVDDEDDVKDAKFDTAEDLSPSIDSKTTSPELAENLQVMDDVGEDDPMQVTPVDTLAKNELETKQVQTDTGIKKDKSQGDNSETNTTAQNLDLEKPWPPDRGKQEELNSVDTTKEISESNNSKPSSIKTSSPPTPSTEQNTPSVVTPQASGKDQSPKSVAQGITPGSLTSSLSQKSSVTPSVTPTQTTHTPSFTTPSPASTSSTSSSKSLQKQKRLKNATQPHPKHPTQSANQQKRPGHHGKPDHHSRSRVSGSGYGRRPSNSQPHPQKYSSSKSRHDGHKKPYAPVARPMATITVGLDASPSKPLGRSELERLRIELESVRNQLDMDNLSPSSLSPCSDEEVTIGKSPAQLLSPVSPVLRSPADSMTNKRNDVPSPAPQMSGPATSLTDRLKLLGKVKKKTPGTTTVVKTEPTSTTGLIKQNDENPVRQSRVLRSSIFDQDSERLSHLSRQLENDKTPEDAEKIVPIPTAVPLFSGSKFLEPTPFPVASKPAVAIDSAGPANVVPVPPISVGQNFNEQQPNLSSIGGPKNVLSLSSSELPATAERRLYDFAGKNCNTDTTNNTNTNHNVEVTASNDTNQLGTQILETSTSEPSIATDDTVLPVEVKQPPSEVPVTVDNISEPPPILSTDIPVNVNATLPDSTTEIKSESEQLLEDKTFDIAEQTPSNLGGNGEKSIEKPVKLQSQGNSIQEPETPQIDDENNATADEIALYDAPNTIPDDYVEEIVCDMDVYAGSCMEISEENEPDVPSVIEFENTSQMDVKLENEETVKEIEQTTTSEIEIGIPKEGEMVSDTSKVSCTGSENLDVVDDSTQPVVENVVADVKCEKDRKHDSMQIKTPETKPETEPTSLVSKTEEFDSTKKDNSRSSDSKKDTSVPVVEAKKSQVETLGGSSEVLPDKDVKKIVEKQDVPKESTKLKLPGKHKMSSKDAKTNSKNVSDLKKDNAKKSKHDDSKKKDLKPSTSKDVVKSEKKELGKATSVPDRITKPEKTGEMLKKQASESSIEPQTSGVTASTVVPIEKKESKSVKTVSLEGKKIKDQPSVGKSKDKDVTKDKKLHKEVKKDKKSSEKKPAEIKSESKKLKKKEKRGDSPSAAATTKIEIKKLTEKPEEKIVSEKVVEDVKKSGLKGSKPETKEVKESGLKGSKPEMKEVKESGLKGTKPETKEVKEGALKKKKKKKHLAEKEKMEKGVPGKDPQPEVSVAEGKSKASDEKTSEAPDKVKKSEKSKNSSKPSSTKENLHSWPSKPKKELKDESSGKPTKKDILLKKSKGHLGLKASHSAPGKAAKRDDETAPSKKDVSKKILHKQAEKASSASPASKKSRYSMIYSSDSESSSDSVGSKVKKVGGKSDNKGLNDKDISGAKSAGKIDTLSSNWPDLDDVSRSSQQRHWSTSSSSSGEDSAGPPPVVASSLLVTETIKNETILPPGFNTGGFTDSDEEEMDVGKSENFPKVKEEPSVSKALEGAKKKKLPPKQDSLKRPKVEKKKEDVKHSGRRLLIPPSDDDSSDGDLVISMSDSDIGERQASSSKNPESKTTDVQQKKSQSNINASLFGSDFTSSDSDDDISMPLKIDETVLADEKIEKKKLPKSSAKISAENKDPKSSSKNASKARIDSDSSDSHPPPSAPVKKKKKKKFKTDKESGKSDSKDAKSSKVEEKQKIPPEKLSKKLPHKDTQKSHSDLSSDSDMETSHKPEKSMSKTSDAQKKAVAKPPAHLSVTKSALEKTKSDSKVMKSSLKGHEKKEKFKAKSHSLEKPPSLVQSKKIKDTSSKSDLLGKSGNEDKAVSDKQRPSSKDRQKGDKKPSTESVATENKTTMVKKEQHKSKHLKTTTGVSESTVEKEPKELKKDPTDQAAKHQKKPLKDGKKSEKKEMVSEVASVQTKDVKSDPKSHHTFTAKSHPQKLGKKKKLKKAHKKDTKTVEKRPESQKKQQEKTIKKEPEVAPMPPSVSKLPTKEKDKKIPSRSLSTSGSEDDNDFELVDDAFPDVSSMEKVPENPELEISRSPKKQAKPGKNTSESSLDSEKSKKGSHSSPHKVKTSTVKRPALNPVPGSKVGEKRRGSGESFLSPSTTDESDVEQRLAVQSAISSLENDEDMKAKDDGDKISEGVLMTGEEATPLVSQSKKPSQGLEGQEKKKKARKTKDVKKEPADHAASQNVSGYHRSKHGLHYGTKGGRDHIEKMKSHERDEEAVRSIMGILDESSDADSYFSDVRPDEGTSSTLRPNKSSDTERSHRLSRDSDISTGFGRNAQEETKAEVTSEPDSTDKKPPATTAEVEKQTDSTEQRTTAEENELAAAVLSIEGLFADFGQKSDVYGDDYSSTTSTTSFSDHRSAEPKAKKEDPTNQDQNSLSQEEVEKGSEEAALAASTLLAESSEEDTTFYGFQKPNISSLSTENEQTSMDIELPSIRNEVRPPTSENRHHADASSTETSSGSRKRPRHKGRGSSTQSSRDSKSDISVSDASMSELESLQVEPGRTASSHNPTKQRKLGKSTNVHHADEIKQSTSVSASTSASRPTASGETLPFVCTSSTPPSGQPQSASAPFVHVSLSTPTVMTTTAVEKSSVPSIKPPIAPSQQMRRTSRDSDGGSSTSVMSTKGRSSSSSSAAVSPTRGLPQLTPPALIAPQSSFPGGMHSSGASVFFSHPTGTDSDMSKPRAPISTQPSGNHRQLSHPHSHYHPHFPPSAQPTYSVRHSIPPHAPVGGSHLNPSSAHHTSFSGVTNLQSMPGHTNQTMPVLNAAGSQLASKSTFSPPTPFPPASLSSAASVTSSASYQTQFVHQHKQGSTATPQKVQDQPPPTQYHVGVPTYPHQHPTGGPPQQQPQPQLSPQRTPNPRQEVPASQNTTPKVVPRPTFTRPPMIQQGHPGYPPHMFGLPGQISPRAIAQQQFALPSPTRPPSAQMSPTASVPSIIGQTQDQLRQRIASNIQGPTYIPQQNIPQVIQGTTQGARPTAPQEAQQPSQPGHPGIEKPEAQRPPSSAPNTSQPVVHIGMPQVSPQSMYRKVDPTQAHLHGPQPGVPHQPLLAHRQMFYPPGLQGLPPHYIPQFYQLRPGIPADMARHLHPGLQLQPPQRMATDKSQTYASLPQTPARKEQPNPTPTTTKVSPNVRDGSHPIHQAYRLPHGVSQPSVQHPAPQIPSHQTQAPSSSGTTATTHPQRTEHHDRVPRVPSEQEQMDMVDQHFRMSLIASTPPKSHSVTTHAPTVPEKPRYATPQKPDPAQAHSTLAAHPGLYQQQVLTRPHIGLHPGFASIPGVRFAPEQHMWPGANFVSPAVPTQAYTSVPSSSHLVPFSTTAQLRMPAAQLQAHVSTPKVTPPPAPQKHDEQVMDLFQRYPVIWQGLLAIKNDSAAVQTHFICGDRALAQAYLPQPDAQSETDKERNLAVLRIIQRMRLEPPQLEGIDKKMMEGTDYCVLLALPCGRDESDVIRQQNALKQCFIDYLKQKQAAGIVNLHQQAQSHSQYVLHVFPPCEFTTNHLQRNAQDLLSNINDIQHIMIVIAAV